MLKYFGRISTWVAILGVIAGLRAVSRMHADPTDDFSFTLTPSEGHGLFRLMPEARVTAILQDRLDLFPRSQAPKLARHLLELCKEYQFDPAFILSLIQVESGFHIKALSPYGAVGLMQIMPETALVTAQMMGIDLEDDRFRLGEATRVEVVSRLLTDPFVNLTFGVAYLSWLRDHYRDRPPYVLVAAYNIGPARMDELLSRKGFKPASTKRYFDAIRRGVPRWRFYRREA
jgi:soluble lytic murein transglycosylase-like protein